MSEKRKILYSPGYGAGWTSWNREDRRVEEYMLTYAPIIEFLERGGKFTEKDCEEQIHPILQELKERCKEKFGREEICVLGACDLRIKEVTGRVRIEEYDGAEKVEEEGEYSGWL